MSNITIYHPLFDQDPELRLKTEEVLRIIQQGKGLQVQLCMLMAEHQKIIQDGSRKKQRGELQAVVCEVFGIEKATYFRYAKAGKVYAAEPDKRYLSIDAVLAKPKALQAPPVLDEYLEEKVSKVKEAMANVDQEVLDAVVDAVLKDDVEYLQSELKELREEVRNLRDEVEFLKEERDDLRNWLDGNTRSKAAGVYDQLKRTMLH